MAKDGKIPDTDTPKDKDSNGHLEFQSDFELWPPKWAVRFVANRVKGAGLWLLILLVAVLLIICAVIAASEWFPEARP